ncbi:MAG: hypothetical protein HLUCCA12_06545 [Rhodobacteraceae bacterium HLUCCA12]|nr:MAG: hypothetical protein HLUCCA12_06545 [Rhodobacteraceae bacterium HLUCCA12]
MKNFVQTGNTLTFTAADPVTAGQGVVMGALFGIAASSAATGESFEAALTGVFTLPKAEDDIATGAALYWDEAQGLATTTTAEGANPLIGAATEAAGTSASTVRARLNGTTI